LNLKAIVLFCEGHNKTHKCVGAVFKDFYVELGGIASTINATL